jgi:hypothetical protein
MKPGAIVQAVYFVTGGLNPPGFPECSATSKYLEKPPAISPARVPLTLGDKNVKEIFIHPRQCA